MFYSIKKRWIFLIWLPLLIAVFQLKPYLVALPSTITKCDKVYKYNAYNKYNSNNSNNTDQLKYIQSNYSYICQYDPSRTKLRAGSHHKTGTIVLNQKILPSIIKYWIEKCTNLPSPYSKSIITDYVDLQRWTNTITGKIGDGHIQAHAISHFVNGAMTIIISNT